MSPVTQYVFDGRKWQNEVSSTRGVAGAVPNLRTNLVYGTYEPSASTTGVLPGTALTDYNSPSVNSLSLAAGTVISNKRIYGDIRPLGKVTLNNCLLVGGAHTPAGASAIVDCNGNRNSTDRIVLTDCTLLPRKPSRNRDGVVGHHYNLFRCDISQTVDGLGIFISPTIGTSASVTAHGNYVHDLVYFYPDYKNGVSGVTWHTDGTHNDCIQIQGGKNIWIKGNRLEATSRLGPGSQGNPVKPWLPAAGHCNGAGIIVQDNTGAGIDNSLVVENNYYSHGLAHTNFKAGMTFIYRENKHYRVTATYSGGAPGTTWSGYYIRLDQRAGTTVTGLNGTNTWIDYKPGEALAEPRNSGICFNV